MYIMATSTTFSYGRRLVKVLHLMRSALLRPHITSINFLRGQIGRRRGLPGLGSLISWRLWGMEALEMQWIVNVLNTKGAIAGQTI